MLEKPRWVVVRWLHVPLGIGLFQSSVEELFLKRVGSTNPDTPNQNDYSQSPQSFTRAGRPGWPYLETEMLNIRSYSAMKHMRDIARELKELTDPAIKEELNKKVFNNCNDNSTDLHHDVKWRSGHTGITPDYWTTVKSDLPWLLSDGVLNMKGPAASARDSSLYLAEQALQGNETYKNAYLARDPLRCFHRDDGFLLTFSPATGHDYVTKDLRHMSGDADQNLARHQPTYSAIAHVFDRFQNSGVDSWQMPTAEWLMVYLITEVITTPHAMRSGYGATEVLDAYNAIVHKLIEQKLQPWTRKKTVSLFQSHVNCIDELKALGRIYDKKLQFLHRLLPDCKDLERSFRASQRRRTLPIERDESPMTRRCQSAETLSERTRFAMELVHDQKSQCDQLAADLTASLSTLFQLRSVEQNERSITADALSRAVFVFTAVTIVFLPLSFVASYFSMNSQGGSDASDSATRAEYWKIAGPLGLLISCSLCVYFWLARSARQQRIDSVV